MAFFLHPAKAPASHIFSRCVLLYAQDQTTEKLNDCLTVLECSCVMKFPKFSQKNCLHYTHANKNDVADRLFLTGFCGKQNPKLGVRVRPAEESLHACLSLTLSLSLCLSPTRTCAGARAHASRARELTSP